MNIEQELKKEGIEIVKKIDTLKVNSVAKNVAEKLISAFPEQGLNYDELFMKLARIDMYIAKMPIGLSGAKYYYKNSSIYFNENIDLANIDIYAIHECIHYLQELKDDKGNLFALGLCDFSNSSLPGMALNEAAVQTMSCKALNLKNDVVKYFDITFPTCSPSYYAIECNLLAQMSYVTGTYPLFNSTLYSNDSFKKQFILATSKNTFYTVQHNIDTIMYLEDEIAQKNFDLSNTDDLSKINKISTSIEKSREKIKKLFIKTQNLILTSYFDKDFKTIQNLEQIEIYRRKLYNYKNYIGTTQGYTFFNEYYIEKMSELEAKYNMFENNTALVPVKNNFFTFLVNKLKKLVGINSADINHVTWKE